MFVKTRITVSIGAFLKGSWGFFESLKYWEGFGFLNSGMRSLRPNTTAGGAVVQLRGISQCIGIKRVLGFTVAEGNYAFSKPNFYNGTSHQNIEGSSKTDFAGPKILSGRFAMGFGQTLGGRASL